MFRASSGSESEAEVGFLFHVMIGVNPLGEFRSVKGIGRNVEKVDIPEGGRNHSPHTRVGPARYKECIIEWGMSNRTTLYDWIHAVEAGYGYKRLVWVIQLGRNRMPMRIYQLMDAWPISWEGAELDANNNAVDTEQITIAYEAVMLVAMPQSLTLPALTIPGTVDLDEQERDGKGVFKEFEAEDTFHGKGELTEIKREKSTPKPGISVGGFNRFGRGELEPEDWEKSTVEDGLGLDDGFRATRVEQAKLRFAAERKDGETKEGGEDSRRTPTPLRFTSTPGEDEPEADESTDESARPASPLKQSGGLFFERTTFGPLKMSGGKSDESESSGPGGSN